MRNKEKENADGAAIAEVPAPNRNYKDKVFRMLFKEKKELYSECRFPLPVPKFIVFYNGTKPQPERRIFRLSDSYEKKMPGEELALELVVLQLNINPGYNEALMGNCPMLKEYTQFISISRDYRQTLPSAEAMERAVDKCIRKRLARWLVIR